MVSTRVTEDSISGYSKLPFAIEDMSFNQWLNDMSKVNKVRALKLLLSTMQLMSKEQLPVENRCFFMQKLSPFVEKISEELRQTYIRNPSPFSSEDKLKLELSVCCAMEVARNYALLCKEKDFSTNLVITQQLKALALFNGIGALSQVYLYKSLLYEKPEKGFWSSCYLFFIYARQHNVVNCVINGQMICFVDRFKQLLIFSLSNTQQFTAEEIVIVFGLLNQVSDEAELLTKVPEKKYSGVPYINLREDTPPSLSKKQKQQEQPYLFYISSLKVIKRLLGALSDKQLPADCNKVMLLRLIKTLTMNQQRKTDRIHADGEFFAVIGFDQIVTIIIEKKKSSHVGSRVNELVGAKLDDILKIDVAHDLLNEDEFRNELQANFAISDDFGGIDNNIKSADIWGNQQEDKVQVQQVKESVENAALLDQSSSGFRLCLKDKMAGVKVGDIVAIFMPERVVITVIRRIIQALEQQTEVGVEILGDFSELLHIFNLDSKGAVWAPLLKGNEAPESIIIKSNDFHNEAYLFSDSDGKIRKYRVEKQLNASAMVKHLKVSLC